MPEQLQLLAPSPDITPLDVDALVHHLAQAAGWLTADDLLHTLDRPPTESNRRRLRQCAKLSRGRVAGGQQGYKLVTLMTHQEYNHFRNWMKSQADEMLARILECDKVFFARQPIPHTL